VIGRLHSYLTVETTTVSDSGSTAVVLVVTGLLVLAGLGMSALAYWYWKSTIPDPESLGPLHSMSARSFAALDEVEQRKALDALRPSLASTVSAESPSADVVAGESVDEPMRERTTIESAIESVVEPVVDDDIWPGDDWSDLDALQTDEPEILVDVFDEGLRVEPETRSRPAPIDPLIG